MNYFISRCNCFLVGNLEQSIVKDVKYLINNINTSFLICAENIVPTYISFCKEKGIFKINALGNSYYIFNPSQHSDTSFLKITSQNKEYFISISNKLIIMYDNEIILKCDVLDVEFCHYEEDKNFLILYFNGLRKFFVVIESGKVVCSSYYDEYNSSTTEKLFMCKLLDSLNHGRVFKLSGGKIEEYVVYLDDYDLKLKPRFICYAFLDCVAAKNYNYCNNLLTSDLRQQPSANMAKFFPDFDYYFEVEENKVVLINKNALAGIYKFEIENNLICNIIQLN